MNEPFYKIFNAGTSEGATKGWEARKHLEEGLKTMPPTPAGVNFGGVRTDKYGKDYIHVDQERSLRHPDEYGGERNTKLMERIAAAEKWDDELYKRIAATKKQHGVGFMVHAG